MRKALSAALLVAGILLLVFGVHAYNSVGSDISRLFTGTPTNHAVWLLVGGAIAAVAGLVGLVSTPRR